MDASKYLSDNPLTPCEELSYELAYQELEAIVTALESEKHSLDECMALFERGQCLVQRCTTLLEQADLKVQQLAGDTLTDFEPGP